MQAASKNTYLSKKLIQAVSKKRQENMQSAALATVPEAKKFKEDEEVKKADQTPKFDKDNSDSEEDEYEKQNRSCESVSSDELDGDLNLSDDEEKAKQFRKQNKAQRGTEQTRKFRQEIDTNVFKVNFASLNEKSEIATGDAVFCSSCKAVMNSFSQLTPVDQEQLWKCEFCNAENKLTIEPEEKPQVKAINYILESSAQVKDKQTGTNGQANQDISVIFCLDHSSSMNSYNNQASMSRFECLR